MAELNSTIVRGSLKTTGKIKSKGYNVSLINAGGEYIPKLSIDVIGNDMYINTHQAKVVINGTTGVGDTTLKDGTTIALTIGTGIYWDNGNEDGTDEAFGVYLMEGENPERPIRGDKYLMIVNGDYSSTGNPWDSSSIYGYISGASINNVSPIYVYSMGASNYDITGYMSSNYSPAQKVATCESYGLTLVGKFTLRDGKWYQDV